MKLKNRTFTGSTSAAVTKREQENREIARRAASEGFVLLKNDGHLLPLAAKGKIGLYGAGAVKTIKGGTGSGDVNERDCVSICQGLKAAGYEVTSDAWLSSYETIYSDARQAWKEEVLRKLKQYDGNFFQAYSTTPFVVQVKMRTVTIRKVINSSQKKKNRFWHRFQPLTTVWFSSSIPED